MSIRRKSCDPCYNARRKCDLTYPVCVRCQKNSKSCHYVYPPQLTVSGAQDTHFATQLDMRNGASGLGWRRQKDDGSQAHLRLDHRDPQFDGHLLSNIPKLLPRLGELPPVSGLIGWTWVADQIRDFPLAFARQAETVFIHKGLYQNSFPRPLRAAFGICAGCVSLNERNRSALFHALDTELSDLLTPSFTNTLLQDLVILQAAVLYQIIRIFYGDVEQRIVAERQEYLLRSYGLKLIRRVDAELQSAPRTWETWILAESIRRTVTVAFKVYTVYSSFSTGKCGEIEALKLLPVSTKSSFWDDRESYLPISTQDETMTHDDFTLLWTAGPRMKLEPFEKLLIVGQLGIDRFEALISSQRLVE